MTNHFIINYQFKKNTKQFIIILKYTHRKIQNEHSFTDSVVNHDIKSEVSTK